MISLEKIMETMETGFRHVLLGLICLLPLLAAAEPVSDVRVVIDVSGSMKQNDPLNLRAPALRLLVELLPEGTRAGVWTFGQQVDMPVELGGVDKAWRNKARNEAGKIHSRGLFTNIEAAVRKASAEWDKPDPNYRRHMILLTDGVVDVSKDPAESARSRRRILEELLPVLQQADATVHTIAMSDKVDFELLQAISAATRGGFERVNTAEELQRIFLRLFEKSVGADTVPIENNGFKVDKDISDITVLVFLAKDSPATQLLTPGKQTYSQQQHPEAVQWHHEAGYDLITVPKPEPGDWALQAKLDPDNRVVVVTNLRMKVDKLPNILLLGDNFDVRARLLEDSKPITNTGLLEKTQFELKLLDAQQQTTVLPLLDDGKQSDSLKGDGVYSLVMDKIDKAGAYQLSVQARSLTFVRELQHSLQVYDSPGTYLITQEAADKPFRISIQPHAGLIRPETVSMQLRLPKQDALTIAQVNDKEWAIEVPAGHANETFVLSMAATRYDDKPLKMEFSQVLAVTPAPQSLAIHKEPVAATAEAANAENKDSETGAATAPAEPTGFDWKIVIGIVVIANLLVFGLGWFAYRRFRQRQQQQADTDAKEMQV